MKTNTELQRDVQDELNWAPNITAGEIGVIAKDGVITLTGNVPSYFEKYAAEKVAGRVAGVLGIAEELKVNLPAVSERTDADIAESALSAMAWNIAVPHDQAKVKVENSWVTLTGQMDWYYQKMAAENTVRHLMGVKGVTNSITLKPRGATIAAEIKSTIEKAFKRAALLEAHRITVTVHDGHVTLNGQAHTWQEKDDAREYAWATPGVSSVKNNIAVVY